MQNLVHIAQLKFQWYLSTNNVEMALNIGYNIGEIQRFSDQVRLNKKRNQQSRKLKNHAN